MAPPGSTSTTIRRHSTRVAGVLVLLLGLSPSTAWAQWDDEENETESTSSTSDEPSPEDVRAAGDEFNRGRAAFENEEYTVAAEHFERADALAPNTKVLLLAIQSRAEADQLARAATLAAYARQRYPADPAFKETRALIERAEEELAKIDVRCNEPCSLVVGTRIVHGRPSARWTLFLESGEHTIRAGWGRDRVVSKSVSATTGESEVVDFNAPSKTSTAAPPSDLEDEFSSEPPASDNWNEPPAEKESSGLSPTWFWVGAGTTVVLAGISTWSGLDTWSNPGPDEVKAKCAGLTPAECPAYQQGVSNQDRTNLLWGVTAGAAVITGILAVFTDWDGDSTDDKATGKNWSPWVGVSDGVSIGATGRF